MSALQCLIAALLMCVICTHAQNVAFASYGKACITPCVQQGVDEWYRCKTGTHHRSYCSPDGGVTASNGKPCRGDCTFRGESYLNCYTLVDGDYTIPPKITPCGAGQ